MREIKFRAWDKRYKGFIHFDLSDIAEIPEGNGHYHPGISSLDGDISANSFHDSLAVQPDYILMQYTGIHDKNDKAVYDGDIATYDGELNPECPRTGYITYRDGAYIWQTDTYWGLLLNLMDLRKLEIIGNIYQDKDLVPNT